jgi:diguanylate cyclase (GGDEF)-like protein/PAS domain S-box-containing protein
MRIAELNAILKGAIRTNHRSPDILRLDDSIGAGNHLTIELKDGRTIELFSVPQTLEGAVVGRVWSFRDITSRKRAEDELERKEGGLKRAREMAQVGHWEQDLENDTILRSSESLKLLGIIGKQGNESSAKVMQKVSAGDKQKLDDAKAQLLANTGKYDVIYAVRRETDGEIRHIRSRAVLEHDENGKPIRMLGVNQDVTDLVQAEERLQQTVSLLTSTLHSTADGILVADLYGKARFCNDQFSDFYGMPSNHVMQMDLAQLNRILANQTDPPQDAANALRMDEPDSASSFVTMALKDGRTIERYSFPQLSEGTIIGRVWSFRDITTRKRAEDALQESERQFRLAIENAPVPIMLHTDDGEVQKINKAWTELTGYTQADIPTIDSWIEKAHGSYYEPVKAAIGEVYCASRISGVGQYTVRIKNGQERIWSFYSTGLGRVGDGRHLAMSVAIDATEQKNKETEILYLSYHDSLTGLYNRSYFQEEANRLNSGRQMPLSVIIGDVNGLKMVNDGFGHQAGDALLVEIANLLKTACRKEDIIARTGGDEFCILLPNTGNDAANEVCKRIYAACAEHDCKVDREWLSLSISLGFATKSAPSESFDATMHAAEENMSRHKLLERRSRNSSLMASIKTTMFEKSNETEEHAERLVALSKRIGEEMALSDKEIDELALLSTLHDIGKMSISDSILKNTGKLTGEEWEQMKKHPEVGYRIALASPELVSIAEGILCHHERWDGTGYPQGIAGKDIPLMSRIISIVDAYDAMTSDRPYRKAMSHKEAIAEITRCAGAQFDPAIAKKFLRCVMKKGG